MFNALAVNPVWGWFWKLLFGMSVVSFAEDDGGGGGDDSGDGSDDGAGDGAGDGSGDDAGDSGDGSDGDDKDPSRQGEDGSQDDGTNWDEELTKHGGPKNVMLENRKKSEKLKQLTQRIAELEKGGTEANEGAHREAIKQLLPKAIAQLKKDGLSDASIDSFVDIIKHFSDVAAAPVTGSGKLEGVLDSIASDTERPVYKHIIKTLGQKKIEAQLKEMKMAPQYWGHKAIVEAAIGHLIAQNHKELFGKGGKRIDDGVLQDGHRPTRSTLPGGVTEDDIKKFAEENNFDLTDPVIRKKVVDAVRAMKASDAK